jgi:hypothetical protein
MAAGQGTYDTPSLLGHRAYLKNPATEIVQTLRSQSHDCEGVLLYLMVTESYDCKYAISGHKIQIYTFNLNQEWQGISEDLLALVA